MAGTSIKKVLENLKEVMYNPNAMQDAVLDTLAGINDGVEYEVLDPNNAVVWSSEVSTMLAQASIESHTKTLQRRNAIMATDFEDLYGHMSNVDWLDIHAQPSRVTFSLVLGKNEILDKAAPRDSLDTRKLIIPRDTTFVVAGTTFTLQYPIEIYVMSFGGLQVIYNTDEISPISEVSSRSLNWRHTTIPINGKQMEMVVIDIPTLQYKITSFNDTITKGISWKNSYKFSDKFFTARVWNRTNSKWIELQTTFSDEVIDPLVPTAQIKVLGDMLTVYLPDVYIRSGLLSGDIRVDIYQTKGKLSFDLSNYTTSEYTATFKDLNGTTPKEHFSPLQTFNFFTLFSQDTVRGGRDSLSFTELKTRVINNSFSGRIVPITEGQLENTLDDLGFRITKAIDYVTERIYHATTPLPVPSIENLSTSIGTLVGIVETNANKLSEHPSVRDNGNRMTIEPTMLFKYVDGLVEINDLNLTQYQRMERSELVSTVNDQTLLFSPFHYVIDFNGDVVETRPYYLSKPEITNKRFVSNNSTLAMDVSTASQTIKVTDYGYQIRVVTRSDDTFKTIPSAQKHAQLSFTPRGYNEEYSRVNGVLEGYTEDQEAVFVFELHTNLDIDRNHDMILTNFTMVGSNPTPVALPLVSTMNIIYAVSEYTTNEYKSSDIDKILVSDSIQMKGISYEVLTVSLGSNLPLLWSNARTIVDGINYQRHEEDVYLTYTKDVIKVDPVTNAPAIKFVTVNGKLKAEFELAHKKGDYILDKDGEIQILHRKGSIKYSTDGEPLILRPRSIGRRLELYLMDAKFIIADTPEIQEYVQSTISQVLTSILTDLPSVDTQLLEKTKLYYYPEITIGLIDVLLGDGNTTRMRAENKFKVSYYLTYAARQNSAFLSTLAETTRSAILVNLKNPTVSSSSITKEIHDRMKDEIIDVELGGLGDDGDQQLYTVVDERMIPTIGKKLVLNPDWTIGVIDDISIAYNSHEINK